LLGCKSVRAHLSASHDGELTGWYATYVRAHSSICPPCKRTRRSMEQVITLLGRMREDETGGGSAPTQSHDSSDHEP
jgi:hypothetical protein